MSQPYPHLLSPLKCGKFIFKNRMESSNSLPHFSQGPEEYIADPLMNHFIGRARNGAALVTLAGFDDNVDSPPFPDTLDVAHFPDFDMRNAKCQNYLLEMIEALHYEGTLVSGSLFSANKKFRYINEDGELEIICADKGAPDGDATHAMMHEYTDDKVTKEELVKIAKSYGQQAAFYKRLGFDAVTIHMSYRAQLPSQMLSPLSNHRTDEFNGSLENRARFPLMMLEEIKKAVGNDMLIEIQHSGVEPEGGYTVEEAIEFLRLAEPYVDIVQVRASEGDENHPTNYNPEKTPFLELTSKIKAAGLDMLVSNVGGWFHPELADKAIAEGKLDLVAMARSWISNPDYGEKLYEDRSDDLVPCIRCNKCHGRGKNDALTTVCSVNPRFGLEAVERYLVTPAKKSKNVAIIGGGPAGMRTALYLTERGHKVTIFEAESRLGGVLVHTENVDFKWTLKEYLDYLVYQVKKQRIAVQLNTRVTPDMLFDNYDAVIAAIGAEPVVPGIPGVEGENVIMAMDVLMKTKPIGQNVVVIGGGEVGTETGMYIAKTGRNVTVLEMRDELAADTTIMHYRSMFQEAWEAIPTFSFVLNAAAKEICGDKVIYTDKDGNTKELAADTVVLSVGMKARKDEALSFYGAGDRFYMVGDCYQPGTVQTVNRSAFVTASSM